MSLRTDFMDWRDERRDSWDPHETLPKPVGYIAGPMTGYPDFNRSNFERVAQDMRSGGLIVVSPVELDDEVGFDPEKYKSNEIPEHLYRDFLLRDIKAILEHKVDFITVLDGWEASKGAALEVHVARTVGLPIFSERGELVKAPTEYKPPSDENVAETALRLVGGDRQDQYGHPIDDFTRTANAINALYGTEFGPKDIPIIMACVKLSRIIQSPDKRDSIVDLIGYAVTYDMVADKEGRPLR